MTKIVSNGGPAFPVHDLVQRDANGKLSGAPVSSAGMTLRDWFAGQALAGLIAQSGGSAISSDTNYGADWAYDVADAMLAARDGGAS